MPKIRIIMNSGNNGTFGFAGSLLSCRGKANGRGSAKGADDGEPPGIYQFVVMTICHLHLAPQVTEVIPSLPLVTMQSVYTAPVKYASIELLPSSSLPQSRSLVAEATIDDKEPSVAKQQTVKSVRQLVSQFAKTILPLVLIAMLSACAEPQEQLQGCPPNCADVCCKEPLPPHPWSREVQGRAGLSNDEKRGVIDTSIRNMVREYIGDDNNRIRHTISTLSFLQDNGIDFDEDCELFMDLAPISTQG